LKMKWERGAEGGAMQRQPPLNRQAGFATVQGLFPAWF
jgi:hypothetical protein